MRQSISQIAETASISEQDVAAFRAILLGWYDRAARVLPWRSRPGIPANPYHVWLSEIMLQQTTVAAVTGYFNRFIERWPTVEALAAAPSADIMTAWAGLGYYARARNLQLCAQIVVGVHGGRFPAIEKALLDLPGIGPYTAAAIASIAFSQPATVVDGNVERVMARWFGIEAPLPVAKPLLRGCAAALMAGRTDRPGDFAQALMDLGATICTPRNPNCGACPVAADCAARQSGRQNILPNRAVKKMKPVRHGTIYWLTSPAGDILLERRPASGLLGGMTGLPTSAWLETEIAREEHELPGWLRGAEILPGPADGVQHVFTHFTLHLTIIPLRHARFKPIENQYWTSAEDISKAGLPTLFRKCARLMLG